MIYNIFRTGREKTFFAVLTGKRAFLRENCDFGEKLCFVILRKNVFCSFGGNFFFFVVLLFFMSDKMILSLSL